MLGFTCSSKSRSQGGFSIQVADHRRGRPVDGKAEEPPCPALVQLPLDSRVSHEAHPPDVREGHDDLRLETHQVAVQDIGPEGVMTNGPDWDPLPIGRTTSLLPGENLDLMPLPNQPRADRTSDYAKAEGESGLYEFREGAFRTRSFCAAAVDCALCRRGGQQTLKLGRADAIELLHLTKLVEHVLLAWLLCTEEL